MLGAIVVWIHIVAAMFWIGGMLFFSLVLIPCLSSGLTDVLRVNLISRVGRRFRVFGWVSLAILLVTGAFRLFQNGIPLSSYGNALKIKFSLVFIMVLFTVLHDFVLGPKSIARSRFVASQNTLLKSVRWMARINLIIGLLIVLSAVFLRHGI